MNDFKQPVCYRTCLCVYSCHYPKHSCIRWKKPHLYGYMFSFVSTFRGENIFQNYKKTIITYLHHITSTQNVYTNRGSMTMANHYCLLLTLNELCVAIFLNNTYKIFLVDDYLEQFLNGHS